MSGERRTIYWHRGVAYAADGTALGRMSLSEAAMLTAAAGDRAGDMAFVRIGLPPT